MDIKETVHRYVLENCLRGESADRLKYSTPLVSSGIIDSISTVGLINFLEVEYGIEFLPRELELQNLETIERIEQLVQKKIQSCKMIPSGGGSED